MQSVGLYLTHWGRDEMPVISQTTLSSAFSWMKMLEFRLKFHWSLFIRGQLTIFQHWFRWWLGADQATSHYLNQWWLDYRRIYASLGLNELMYIILFSCISLSLRPPKIINLTYLFTWTDCGLVTHYLPVIELDQHSFGQRPGSRRQTITWKNDDALWSGPSGTKNNNMWTKYIFRFQGSKSWEHVTNIVINAFAMRILPS